MGAKWRNDAPPPPRLPAARVDPVIAALAADQHGTVSRAQLLASGVGRRAIQHRISRKRLIPVHHGVYSVGLGPLTRHARWMAAVLAGGADAVLSHRSAAELWELIRASLVRLEITIPRKLRPRPRLVAHFSRLPNDETTRVDGIPVTGVSRTLLDLAAVLDVERLERAISQAEGHRLRDRVSLAELLERYPRRPGTRALRRLLPELRPRITRSELEDLFLAFLDEHGLPQPQTNVWLPVGGRSFEVDCLWRPARLVVELDGRAFHDTSHQFEADRARDRALAAAGFEVLRVTWRQLTSTPRAVAGDLRAVLSGR